MDVNPDSSARAGVTAPVSHQKRPNRSATNAVGFEKYSKINEAGRYSAAHNGPSAGLEAGKYKPRQGVCRSQGERYGITAPDPPEARPNLAVDTSG